MFTPRRFLAAAASLAFAHAAAAQVVVPNPRDDLLFYGLQRQVVFDGPTLVVLVPLPTEGNPLDATTDMAEWRASVTRLVEAARTVAGRHGYTVVARDPDHASLSAMRGDSYFTAPRNMTTGYILITPLRRPRLQAGYLQEAELEALVRDYETPGRPLAL